MSDPAHWTQERLLDELRTLRERLNLRPNSTSVGEAEDWERFSQHLATLSVPAEFQTVFLQAQANVARYFRDRVHRPDEATISIAGERYAMRAASMSVEFVELVTSLYQDQAPAEARSVANNLLFDFAHSIGKADARSFHQKMGLVDPIERLSAGPVHFAFSGWAFVHIFAESRPSPDEDYFLIFDHPFSFESNAWLAKGRSSDRPVCIMNAGYSSGWCEESFGLPLVSAEVECIAAGGEHCRFIMAPPSRIEEHLERHERETAGRGAGGDPYPPRDRPSTVAVPEFFQRAAWRTTCARQRTSRSESASAPRRSDINERRNGGRRAPDRESAVPAGLGGRELPRHFTAPAARRAASRSSIRPFNHPRPRRPDRSDVRVSTRARPRS